jgi:hypothetical protein
MWTDSLARSNQRQILADRLYGFKGVSTAFKGIGIFTDMATPFSARMLSKHPLHMTQERTYHHSFPLL